MQWRVCNLNEAVRGQMLIFVPVLEEIDIQSIADISHRFAAYPFLL